MYKIPIILAVTFTVLLILNIVFFVQDYKTKIQKDVKWTVIPNSLALGINVIGLILTAYYFFVIYNQLH